MQDAGAQYAAPLLDAQPGERVLDACAAPGGKTGHILERTPGLAELVALDIDGERLSRVAANLKRLGLSATLQRPTCSPRTGGMGGPSIASCSMRPVPARASSAAIRTSSCCAGRTTSNVSRPRSASCSCAAPSMLKPGGRLVYATCSILPDENQEVVEAFLALDPRMHEGEPGPGAVAHAQLCWSGTQSDGFYYACLTEGRSMMSGVTQGRAGVRGASSDAGRTACWSCCGPESATLRPRTTVWRSRLPT